MAKKPAGADPAKKIRQQIRRARKKAERKGMRFTALDNDEVRRKLKRANSPMIVFQSWSDAAPGGTVSYTVGISNPDSFSWSSLYVHVFVGPANPVADLGDALQCVDDHFDRLTQPDFFGLSLPANGSDSVTIALPVPARTEPSEYLGNSVLFQASYHDVGQYFDRGCFPFTVN